MLKRYIILTIAFSFMTIAVPKCPFRTVIHSATPRLAQSSTATHSAATQSAAARL